MRGAQTKKKGFRTHLKLISLLVIMLLIGVVAVTISAQIISQEPIQDSSQDEIQEDTEEIQDPYAKACEQLRLRKRDCSCSLDCSPQNCQYQKRNCGC